MKPSGEGGDLDSRDAPSPPPHRPSADGNRRAIAAAFLRNTHRAAAFSSFPHRLSCIRGRALATRRVGRRRLLSAEKCLRYECHGARTPLFPNERRLGEQARRLPHRLGLETAFRRSSLDACVAAAVVAPMHACARERLFSATGHLRIAAVHRRTFSR